MDPDRNPIPPATDAATVQMLVEALYGDLHQLARHERRRVHAPGTLSTTALVHEAYLKLFKGGHWVSQAHFLNTAALAMRQALVQHARMRLAAKRGGGAVHGPLDDADGILAESDERIVALDEALETLGQQHPRLARVVECRYFAGLTELETANALGVTDRTVQRDWAKAKAMLYETLGT